jgi:hypothetical protein
MERWVTRRLMICSSTVMLSGRMGASGAMLTVPNPDLFVFMYALTEAVLSSQIDIAPKSNVRHALHDNLTLVSPRD